MKIINEHIGYVKVKNLNAKTLDKFYNYLRDEHINKKGEHYNPSTIQYFGSCTNFMGLVSAHVK